jgi:hemerythrin
VGEDHLDNQHKKLLAQVNKVIEAMVFGATSKEVSEAISFFDEYITEHFSDEEDYMRKHNYPNLKEHQEKHQDFIKSYFSFKEKLKSGVEPRELIMDIETFLGQWWITHIGKEDRKYHIFIDGVV